MSNSVELHGVRLYKVSDEERMDYALAAEVEDNDLEEIGFIKAHINPAYSQGSRLSINTFQPYVVTIRDQGGVKTPRISGKKTWDGKPFGIGFAFDPDRLGILRADIPITPFNIKTLIDLAAHSEVIVVDDKEVKATVKKQADKIRKAEQVYKDAAKAYATYEVERTNAPTLKSMREKFGEVLDGIKEYDESFGAAITTAYDKYYNEFLEAGKVTKTVPTKQKNTKPSEDVAK